MLSIGEKGEWEEVGERKRKNELGWRLLSGSGKPSLKETKEMILAKDFNHVLFISDLSYL